MKYTIKINAQVCRTSGYSEFNLHETEIELTFPETGIGQVLTSDQIPGLLNFVEPALRKALEGIESNKITEPTKAVIGEPTEVAAVEPL